MHLANHGKEYLSFLHLWMLGIVLLAVVSLEGAGLNCLVSHDKSFFLLTV